MRQVALEPELVQLLREHKIASQWGQPEDFVFAGRIREKPRERNRVRTRILYGAIEKANELLAAEGRPPLPEGITFHALRRTYAALRAELGEHPAITAAQMGHRDPRMTLRLYTDVTGRALGPASAACSATIFGHQRAPSANRPESPRPTTGQTSPKHASACRRSRDGSDGTRTRGLRRSNPRPPA